MIRLSSLAARVCVNLFVCVSLLRCGLQQGKTAGTAQRIRIFIVVVLVVRACVYNTFVCESVLDLSSCCLAWHRAYCIFFGSAAGRLVCRSVHCYAWVCCSSGCCSCCCRSGGKLCCRPVARANTPFNCASLLRFLLMPSRSAALLHSLSLCTLSAAAAARP